MLHNIAWNFACQAVGIAFADGHVALLAHRHPEQLDEIGGHLDAMRAACDDVEKLNHHDAAFHRAVVSATGNETLSTLLDGISGRTLRMRVWRGTVEAGSSHKTVAEHVAIYNALAAGDPTPAQPAARSS
jgi:GntR family transcriptional repressor for pyruvate dehydrogenase complex